MRLVHLSDPHLSDLDGYAGWRLRGKRRLGYLSWMRRRRHHHRRDVLEQLCSRVALEQADVIAVTGDLVQLGLPGEIAQARAWLDGLGAAPLVLVPGNHDLYRDDAVDGVLASWSRYLHLPEATLEAFPSRFDWGPLTVIGLCSAYAAPFWSAAGRLGAAQLARLDDILAASSGRLRCVLVHHPPLPGQCAPRKALRDAAELAGLLQRHGVELVLHGHIHRNAALRHAAHTRVLATASASNADTSRRASYRVLDIAERPDRWLLDARLMTLDGDGGVSCRDHLRCEFPRR